jgi:putative Mn2+ efflux pump MntP
MIKSIKDEKVKSINMNMLSMLGFAFLVSLDSFTVGMGIYYITSKPIYASIVFSIVSFLLTLLGYILGKYVSKKIEKLSKYIGTIILLTLLGYFLF